MPKKGGNISLSSYDDIFQTDQSREEAQQERVQEIPLSELHPFKGHPFKVLDDEAMQKTVESIAQFGVMTPAIARPRPEGGYEIIAGHRRHHASELAGKDTMPVIVRDMDDDAATILMVDSNLQRETLLPSERAFAFKMKLDAMKRQGMRTDLTSVQVAPKLTTAIIGEESGMSSDNVKRYIRLTNLIPELLDMAGLASHQIHRDGPITVNLLRLLIRSFPFLYLSVSSCFDHGDVLENWICLGRTDRILRGFQRHRPVGGCGRASPAPEFAGRTPPRTACRCGRFGSLRSGRKTEKPNRNGTPPPLTRTRHTKTELGTNATIENIFKLLHCAFKQVVRQKPAGQL